MNNQTAGDAPAEAIRIDDCESIPRGWTIFRLGDIADIKTGSRNNQDKVEDGKYPFFVRSDVIERIDTYSHECEAIIVPGEGGVGSIFHYINGRFELHQRAYKISDFRSDMYGKFIYYAMTQHFGPHAMKHTVKATVDSLRLPTFDIFRFSAPQSKFEQCVIAETLSDIDRLLESLETLITKKQAIKQATMQQLLNGKTRLPRFSGAWETRRLGDIAQINTGSRNNQDKVADGRYPFFVRSATVERIDSYSSEGEAILVPGEGDIGNIFHYINGRFDVHQRVYQISRFSEDVCSKFVYYNMILNFGNYAMLNTVKATVDSLRLPTFKNFSFSLPNNSEEQWSIAAVLSDMDTEIAALERRRDKTRALKQGMMQQLLTGRTRLMTPE